jgi:hypothetical protein
MITKQLFPLNNLLRKLFYKYLLRKYSSVPKIYSHIKTNFRNQNRFIAKSKVLFKTTDLIPLNSVSVVSANDFLTANVCVDQNIMGKQIN